MSLEKAISIGLKSRRPEAQLGAGTLDSLAHRRQLGGQIVHHLRHTSRFATFSAFSWMNSRRGSTTSPIRVEKTSSA